MANHFYKIKIQSPVGELSLLASDTHLYSVFWESPKYPGMNLPGEILNRENSILKETKIQLREYFNGERKKFDLPIKWSGTDFQNAVWKALTKIPYGETSSYSQLAEAVKNPKAVRAVGMTNGRNPIAIVVPCHRVIGKNGSLTGFGGGLKNKEILLKLENTRFGQVSHSENLSFW